MSISDLADAFRKAKSYSPSDLAEAIVFLRRISQAQPLEALRAIPFQNNYRGENIDIINDFVLDFDDKEIAIKAVQTPTALCFSNKHFLFTCCRILESNNLTVGEQGPIEQILDAVGYETYIARAPSLSKLVEIKNHIIDSGKQGVVKELLTYAKYPLRYKTKFALEGENQGYIATMLAWLFLDTFDESDITKTKDIYRNYGIEHTKTIYDGWMCGVEEVYKNKKDPNLIEGYNYICRGAEQLVFEDSMKNSYRHAQWIVQTMKRVPVETWALFAERAPRISPGYFKEVAPDIALGRGTPEDKAKIFSLSPSKYLDKIKEMLLSDEIKNKSQIIKICLPKVYSLLGDAFLASVWSNSNIEEHIAIIESIGKNLPISTLIFIVENYDGKIKEKALEILSGYNLDSLVKDKGLNDKEDNEM